MNDVVAPINGSLSTTGVAASRSLTNVNTVAYAADATNNNVVNVNGVNLNIVLTSAHAGDLFLKDDPTSGVLEAVNGGPVHAARASTYSACITLSAKIGSTITVAEGSSTPARAPPSGGLRS